MLAGEADSMDIDYYAVLGVDTDADSTTIRESYKKLALMYHPDKVPVAEREEAELRFKTISEAYETLIDEENRMLYDAGTQFGGFDWQDYYQQQDEFSPSHSRHHSFTTSTTFNAFQSTEKNERTSDYEYNVTISLKEVLQGKEIQLKTLRDVICRKCNGSGGRKGANKRKCTKCNGCGEFKQVVQVAPGVYKNENTICFNCRGEGIAFKPTSLCTRCDGTKLQPLESLIDIIIPPGVPDNHQIVLAHQADEEIGKETGDIIVNVLVTENQQFNREGDDLYAESKISLREALTGFSKCLLTNLDGNAVNIECKAGTIVKPGDIIRIPNQGLPNMYDQERRGTLFVYLHIEFPKTLSPAAIKDLALLLPSKPASAATNSAKPVHKFDIITERDLPRNFDAFV